MKLELKHLAPYLPYNLTCNILGTAGSLGARLWKKNYLTASALNKFENNLEFIQPILKPLLDLDFLITNQFEIYNKDDGGNYSKEIIDLFCYEKINHSKISECDFQRLPYECIEFMLRNHYDFFGLIPEGLAISIHNVE